MTKLETKKDFRKCKGVGEDVRQFPAGRRFPCPPKFLYDICRTPYPPIQWTIGNYFLSNRAAIALS
jgi:hypothetical protein